ncbi:OmpA family protein [Lutimaribacter sp. EGI FJ00015]|uniref:OmpA family protein n=1 Tax=Lutimaribacter degradans TaxID=2945989 RepID=A0ACC5ZVB7_9RHOB|nr:OmpA family protein [Lutimaribacter sp. EGI FJ00013]MCM2561696.1 OmpA family protein [Lutimaribacter sp. EGI FJ00013]MCO0612591.1 OmpA family protein [Lutimaribacter sp. EGI FJ00015]MCO0635250.1 OmpA family protein [Lutimaribacter sp. EGI FJ00014]
MTSRSLKTTTAILTVLSLMQPATAMAQVRSDPGNGNNRVISNPGERGDPANIGDRAKNDRAKNDRANNRANDRSTVRSFQEICDEAMISDARACEILLRERLLVAEGKAELAADRAEKAVAKAEAAEKSADVAKPTEMGAARIEATRLKGMADVATARARVAAETVETLTRETEAAAKVAENAEIDADVKTQADADAAAQVADDKARADANAAAKAQVDAQSEAEADAAAAEKAEALVTADLSQEDAADPETAQPLATSNAQDCLAQVLNPDGTIRCLDDLTPGSIAAVAADADTETQGEVVTETVTESTHRSSSEEFSEWTPEEQAERAASGDADAEVGATAQTDSGMSDLEKAGLFVLGAVAVGAILSNGQRVETNTGDRVIVQDDDGSYQVLKDDDALLRQPGSEVRTERFNDGSTRTTVTREDGTKIVTIRDSTGRALRRLSIAPDGREYLLIDDTRSYEPVVVRQLPRPAEDAFDYREASDAATLRQALIAAERNDIGRSFSLRQVREYSEVRQLAPVINLQAVTFATNSAALQPSQAERLRQMGLLMRELIAEDPTELFLVEGHTDAVGGAGYNLLLSDRRAESVALAFNEYFGVPTQNMIVQGYGERYLKIPTQQAERVNRRVAVRRITTLLQRN